MAILKPLVTQSGRVKELPDGSIAQVYSDLPLLKNGGIVAGIKLANGDLDFIEANATDKTIVPENRAIYQFFSASGQDLSNYETKTHAASTYETKTDAASTYQTKLTYADVTSTIISGSPASSTVYHNSLSVPIVVYIVFQMTPSTTVAGSCSVYTGASSSLGTPDLIAIASDSIVGKSIQETITIRVPPNWYFEIVLNSQTVFKNVKIISG